MGFRFSLIPCVMGVLYRLIAAFERLITRPKKMHAPEPTLPVELWDKVMRHCISVDGLQSFDLDSPFEDPASHDLTVYSDAGLLVDRASLRRVCYQFLQLVERVAMGHPVIGSQGDLVYHIRILQHQRYTPSQGAKRIDLNITGSYRASDVATLLSLTPNLTCLTFNNCTEQAIPNEVIAAVCKCPEIRRLEFNSLTEAPLFDHLVKISHQLDRLETLRVAHIARYPPVAGTLSDQANRAAFGALKTLSLDFAPSVVPPPNSPRNSFIGWCFLLGHLSTSDGQLPALERVEFALCPPLSLSFFDVHGHKIRMLKTATGSMGPDLYEVFALCPQLWTLLLDHGGTTSLQLPKGHNVLERISVTLTGSPENFRLDWLEGLCGEVVWQNDASSLQEVMVRDLVGISYVSECRNLMIQWGASLLRHGVLLVDEKRNPYVCNASRSTFDLYSIVEMALIGDESTDGFSD